MESLPLTQPVQVRAQSKPGVLQQLRRMQPWHWAPYIFISPFFILFAIFALFPIFFSIYLAFHTWDPAMGLSAMKYVGFENFTFALGDSWFWKSLWNTTWIALASGAPQHLIAIPLAFFINQSFKKWRNPVLGMYFLPYITSTVAIAMIFGTLFSRDFGVINAAIAGLAKLPLLGAILPTENINWLGNKLFIKPAVSFVIVWRYVGWNTVLYLAAMQTIPKDLYEAARMDGANTRQQFFNITLPMIRPMMFFAISLTIIGNLQIFEEPFILMGPSGGLGQTALTSAMFMYRTAFEFNDFGTASAMSWMLFLLIGVLTVVNNKIFATDDGRNG